MADELDKEDVLYLYNEILVIKKSEIMPSVATGLDLEIIILNEVRQKKTYQQSESKFKATEIILTSKPWNCRDKFKNRTVAVFSKLTELYT